jgi:hypothetical protein
MHRVDRGRSPCVGKTVREKHCRAAASSGHGADDGAMGVSADASRWRELERHRQRRSEALTAASQTREFRNMERKGMRDPVERVEETTPRSASTARG